MPKIKLTQEKYSLVDVEDYGELSTNSWCLSSSGYAKRGTKKLGKTTIHYMHRQIMGYPQGYVDHINGDKLDNRRKNLRVVNQSINGHNRHKINKNNTSGHRGIWFDRSRNKYCAEIWVNYKKYSKRFDTLTEALKQRNKWEEQLCSR